MSDLHDKQQNNQNAPADSPIRLDRLVDGEVNIDEQRQLLLALEAQPDGWRRCALAYIEAQTLRQELRGIGNKLDTVETGDKPQTAGSGISSRHNLRWLAMAACFVLAFGIGTATRGFWMNDAAKAQPEKQVAT